MLPGDNVLDVKWDIVESFGESAILAAIVCTLPNPTTGFLVNLTVDIPVFGALYSDDRIVQGYTLGSPATNASISREARIRFGYFRRLPKCLAIDVFIEKRSFNFADPVMPDLYTKSKRYGAELSCLFGKT